jgi:hypothetical protein
MPDTVVWITAVIVAAAAFYNGFAGEGGLGFDVIVAIPLVTLALAVLRPMHLVTIVFLVLALDGIALVARLLHGYEFYGGDMVVLVFVAAGTAAICVSAALAAKHYAFAGYRRMPKRG